MENAEKQYSPKPIEKPNEGVSLWNGVDLNFKKISKKHRGELKVTNASGKPFLISIGPDQIRIDFKGIAEDIYLEAKLKKDERGKSLLEFNMKTDEEETGRAIPGLYAQRLIDRVIEYFDKKNIDSIGFSWHEHNAKYEKRISDIRDRWIRAKQKLK